MLECWICKKVFFTRWCNPCVESVRNELLEMRQEMGREEALRRKVVIKDSDIIFWPSRGKMNRLH